MPKSNRSNDAIPMIGKRFGKLLIVEVISKGKMYCKCDCGNERVFDTYLLKRGNNKSCGCLLASHGHTTKKWKSQAYSAYHSMIDRCHKPNHRNFKRYGGRGISVCERWRGSFIHFLEDMGEPKENETLDRINNEKGYSPENCRWTTNKINTRNTSVSKRWFIDGVKYESSTEAAKLLDVSVGTIHRWCSGYKRKGKEYPPKDGCWSERVY